MAKDTRILVDLQRCTGCWTCSLSCKTVNDLPDEEYWCTVRTLGSGEGIDRPSGIWPNLHMSWMPVWSNKCTLCAPRQAEGDIPFCVKCCPNKALVTGEAVDEAIDNLREKGFRLFSLPAWESTREGILYASKE